ncbi:MAG: aspartate kinase [Spirochaetes bacterium]|jgi:aspartate kinase|nr:aspartate kinase [Spirochaetota bacterium]
MIVYKFGGASVKDALSFQTVANIISNNYTKNETIIIIISAMGKTTNLIEKITEAYFENNQKSLYSLLSQLAEFHLLHCRKLFHNNISLIDSVSQLLSDLESRLKQKPSENYNYEYDQIVSYGELLSSNILSLFLQNSGFSNTLLDSRRLIRTDSTYRSAHVEWETTTALIQKAILTQTGNLYVTQGFIGGTAENITTTLGREGSDFSASIYAFCCNAREVTIWKDVPGVLNADPLHFPDAEKMDYLSYHDAIELSYYGAKVIHPKTVKPLQNRGIPLFVKSFLNPLQSGTKISEFSPETKTPSFIIKKDQTLLTISPRDFSFIAENHLGFIFQQLADLTLTINMMQNSALSFSLCLDTNNAINTLLNRLTDTFSVRYNENTELITIWHYDTDTIDKLTTNCRILLEERTRHTVQFLIKSEILS